MEGKAVPSAIEQDLGSGRIGDREICSVVVVADVDVAPSDFLRHHLQSFLAIVDQNGHISVGGHRFSVLEGIEDNANTNKFLLKSMDDALGVVS